MTTRRRKKTRKRKLKKPVNSIKRVFDGIEFDSTPEMDMYILLKKAGIKFAYTGKSKGAYVLFSEGKYLSECYERARKNSPKMRDFSKINGMSYTPDFIGENHEWIIEVKGRKIGDFNMRWKLFKHHLNKSDNPPILFMPTNTQDMEQVITILKSKGYATK